MRVAKKGKGNRRVANRHEDKWRLERDAIVEWICTLPQGKEPRVIKVGGEVVIRTRGAMGVVGATLTAKLKALNRSWC